MEKTGHRLVVIGGSLGGMDAVGKILSCLPETFECPIVIVLHRMKNVKSSLVELLQKRVKLKVSEAEEKEKIEKGNVYVAPSNYHLLIEKDFTFSLDNSGSVNYSKPSIDLLFESASWCCGKKVTGILLSGANSDGGKGLELIKRNGGYTIVQDPEEALAPTMPLSAINLFKVDRIEKVDNIADVLLKNKL